MMMKIFKKKYGDVATTAFINFVTNEFNLMR